MRCMPLLEGVESVLEVVRYVLEVVNRVRCVLQLRSSGGTL